VTGPTAETVPCAIGRTAGSALTPCPEPAVTEQAHPEQAPPDQPVPLCAEHALAICRHAIRTGTEVTLRPLGGVR
jgi:hypothetical protein